MIYADRIRMRQNERSDIPTFTQWLNDPEVVAGLSIYLPISHAAEEKWFENMLTLPMAERPLAIEARLGENGSNASGWKLIGNCSFHEIDWKNRTGEIGILIGEKEYWNRGYGTEVMRLMLRHGFETLNLNRVYLRVFHTNPRAIHCYEKAGFVHEGRLRQGEFKHGAYMDVLLMGVLRSEWPQAGV